MEVITNYLKQKTTWVGLLTQGAAIVGYNMSEGMMQSLAALGVAIVGVALMVYNENKNKEK